MAGADKVPNWLTDALERVPPWAPTEPWTQGSAGEAPQPGELRLAGAPAAGDLHRLLLVVDVDVDAGSAAVVLTHNEPELATDSDLILPPELTGLPFMLCLEADITGTLPMGWLGAVAARVEAEVVRAVKDLEHGRCDRKLDGLRGMPLSPHEDHRRGFKAAEARVIGELTESRDTISRPRLLRDETSPDRPERDEAEVRGLVADAGAAANLLGRFKIHDEVKAEGERVGLTLTPSRPRDPSQTDSVYVTLAVFPEAGSPEVLEGVGVHLSEQTDAVHTRRSGRLDEQGRLTFERVPKNGTFSLSIREPAQPRVFRPLRDYDRIAAASGGARPSVVLKDATESVTVTIHEIETGQMEAIIESHDPACEDRWVELPVATPGTGLSTRPDRLFAPLRWNEPRSCFWALLSLGSDIELADDEGLWVVDQTVVAEAAEAIILGSVKRSDNWTRETWRRLLDRSELPDGFREVVRKGLGTATS